MKEFLFTALVRGKITAYSQEQISDHFKDWNTQSELSHALAPDHCGIKLSSVITLSESVPGAASSILKRPIYASNDYVGDVTQIRDRIALKLYRDHMVMLQDYIHRLGLQIEVLRSVRDGWMTTHIESIKLSEQYEAEILALESQFGYNFPGAERSWSDRRIYRFYSDYSFKWRDISDLSKEDLRPFLDAADSIIREFGTFFFVRGIESKLEANGTEVIRSSPKE
jgi:hypothetical protein